MKDYEELRRKFDLIVKETGDLRNQEKSNTEASITIGNEEFADIQTKIQEYESYLKRADGSAMDEKELKAKSSSVHASLHQALKRLQGLG